MSGASDARPFIRLDEFLPAYDFSERHSIQVRADPQRTFQALKQVTPAEVPLFRWLMRIRALPAQAITGRRFSFDLKRPILGQFLTAGFVVLAEEPHRELVVGRIAQFWKLVGGSAVPVRNAAEFVAFQEPGYAKAALNFFVAAEGDRVQVRTETRVRATDPASRARFACYWRLIGPGSAMIRRSWLRAIKRRAERDSLIVRNPSSP